MKNTSKAHPVVFACLLTAFTLRAGGEWTRFRGPNGTGISTASTVPAKWTGEDYNWKVELPGRGHSSPVLWGNRIFVTAAKKETGARIVLCLEVSAGNILWKREYESETYRMNRDNSYASSTPAVDKDHVYVYWTAPEEVTVLALDHKGKEVWRRNLGPFKSRHGSGTSPMIFEDTLVLTNDQLNDSFLIALKAKNGETRWRLERKSGKTAYSVPTVYTKNKGCPELIFTSTMHGVTSVDPKTGKINWELEKAFPERVVSSPVAGSGLLFGTCGVGGRGKRFVAVRPGSKEEGTEPKVVYELKRRIPYVPTPLAKDGLLFLLSDTGFATCLRASSGEKLWQERLGARFYGSFVWVEGRLYAVSRKGVVFVLKASEKFELLARNQLGETAFTTPAVAGGVMYIRTLSHLLSIGGKGK